MTLGPFCSLLTITFSPVICSIPPEIAKLVLVLSCSMVSPPGTNVATGATVGSVNTNTRVITLTATNTGVVNGNVIFGEETSVNWVNIDIQRTKGINAKLSSMGGTSGSRLYLFGYTDENSPPTAKVQGFAIGARRSLYNSDSESVLEQMPMRSFQASHDYVSTFGLGVQKQVDSLIIFWPDGNISK